MGEGLTALVLCGGLGTRLRSAVSDRPKFLAEVDGRPFADFVLEALGALGCVQRVVLCTGYMGDLVEAALGRSRFGLELAYSREATPLGTGGALRNALPQVATARVIALNGDSMCEADLAPFVARHRAGTASIVVARVDDARSFGRVILGDGDRVARFEEKSDAPGAAWVNAGAYLFEAAKLASVASDRAVSFEREVLPRFVEGGLYAWKSASPLIDIGTPESYAAARARLRAPRA